MSTRCSPPGAWPGALLVLAALGGTACGDGDAPDDAAASSGATPGVDPFCATRPVLTFCEDFDERPLPGAFAASTVEGSATLAVDGEATASPPSSMLASIGVGPGTGTLHADFEPSRKLRFFGQLHIDALPAGGEDVRVASFSFETLDVPYEVGFGFDAGGKGFVYQARAGVEELRAETEVTLPAADFVSVRLNADFAEDGTGKLALRFGEDVVAESSALTPPASELGGPRHRRPARRERRVAGALRQPHRRDRMNRPLSLATHRGLAAAALSLALAACSSPESSPAPDDTSGEGVELPGGGTFTRAGLLASVATCVAAETATFAEAANVLATSATADVTSDGPSSEDTRAAWRTAMAAWQRVEVMQIGPQADATQPGGKDLREPIYAWPLESPCAVDEALVSEAYGDIPALLVNARGLAAIEYLAFHEGAENACTPQATINTSGSWEAIDASELETRRRTYAKAAADDVAALGNQLADLWSSEGGNFAFELANAGNGSSAYPKVRLALNAISDALFYIEYATKDLKVARPAGLTLCASAACPELVESPWAGASKDNVLDDLAGFQRIFDGCDAEGKELGFDDFLYAVGRPEVSADIDAAVLDAIAAASAIEEPDLASALETDQASVIALHTALKRITDLLRTELISVLDLELPKRVEGDND